MENAVHMNGMEDFIDNPRRVGDRVKSFKWRSSRDSARQTTR